MDQTGWKIQLYEDIGDIGGFYEALKAVYDPMYQVQVFCAQYRRSDATYKAYILNRWSEYFQAVVSTNRSV